MADIQPTYKTLKGLFNDRVFRIPHYQRFYSWQKRQREDLFSDLEELAKKTTTEHHFMATIVCYRTSELKPVGTSQYWIYEIVDGQQRLTTLIILLKCIEIALPTDSIERRELGSMLVKQDGQLVLLQTNNANDLIFNRFIRDGISPDPAELQIHADFHLKHAIDQCRSFVKKWSQNPAELMSLLTMVLHRLGFVAYDIEDETLVYTIFEVLNSRGLDVDWLDKTKSMLMGRVFELAESKQSAESQIRSLQNIWGKIYLELAKHDVPGDEVLRTTATLNYGANQGGKPRSAENSLIKIRDNCTQFSIPTKLSEALLDYARKLTTLRGKRELVPVAEILQARILGVAIMSIPNASDSQKQSLLDQLERITFRIYYLFGIDARKEAARYIRLAARITKPGSHPLSPAKVLEELKDIGQAYPVDHALACGIFQQDCYARSEMCRYILWQFEEHLAERLGTAATLNDHDRMEIWRKRAADTIEHIFPQKPENEPGWKGKMRRAACEEEDVAKHVGRIGNLILLPKPLNSGARTLPFIDKQRYYNAHNLRMVAEICKYQDWTLDSIEQREATIVAWAMKRWADIE